MNASTRVCRVLALCLLPLALFSSQSAQAVDAELRNLLIESPAAPIAQGIEGGPSAALNGCEPDGVGGVTSIGLSVFIPEHNPGDTMPIILTSHGWGGSRSKNPDAETSINELFGSIDGLIVDLWESGYLVLSFDERGWGESSGKVRGIDRTCETQDAIAVLNWAESDPEISKLIARESNGDMVLGTVGGSYGGGFQFMLSQEDPRVDVMVPMGTWNSLTYALTPNTVLKRGFASLLCGLGLANADLDDVFYSGCIGALNPSARTRTDITSLDVGGLNAVAGPALGVVGQSGAPVPASVGAGEFIFMLEKNGIDYFDGADIYYADYNWDDLSPPRITEDGTEPFFKQPANPNLDVLLIQGNRDVLFNMNEAVRNYNYYSSLGIGDVRLFTNDSGHMNPIANQVNSSVVCGDRSMWDVTQKWFDEKLLSLVETPLRGSNPSEKSKPRCKGCKVERQGSTSGRKPACRGCKVERTPETLSAGAGAVVNAVSIPEVCISLDERSGIELAAFPAATVSLTIDPASPVLVDPASDYITSLPTIAQTFSQESLAFTEQQLPTQAPTFVEVTEITEEGLVLAGIPYWDGLIITATNPAAQAYAYIAVGIMREGQSKPILLDDQVQPFIAVEGALLPEAHASAEPYPDGIELAGIGQGLEVGDKVGLLLFYEHPQYEFGSSVLATASIGYSLSGTVYLPIFEAPEGSISTYTGEIPPIECNTTDPVGFVYSYSVCLDSASGN